MWFNNKNISVLHDKNKEKWYSYMLINKIQALTIFLNVKFYRKLFNFE